MCKKSESISNLAMALVKFNSEVSKVSKDAENPFFKNNYASLDNIIDEVRPILQKNGLSILQLPGGDGENIIMKTMILHESGEWIESDPLIMKPIKNDPQAVGSAITYARRYSLAAILSLNTGEDDDGNKATHQTNPNAPKGSYNQSNQQSNKSTNHQTQQSSGQTGSSDVKLASEAQIKMLRAKMNSAGFKDVGPINSFLDMSLSSITELPMAKVNELIKYLDECKQSV